MGQSLDGSEGPVPMLYDDDPSVPPFIPKQRPIAFHLYQNLVQSLQLTTTVYPGYLTHGSDIACNEADPSLFPGLMLCLSCSGDLRITPSRCSRVIPLPIVLYYSQPAELL